MMPAWYALHRRRGGILVTGCCLTLVPVLAAQVAVSNPPSGGSTDPLQVVIEREPLVLRAPETYKVSLHLDPIRSVEAAARLDGIVESVVEAGSDTVQAQAEVLRLDSQERKLQLDRAKAALEAARIAQEDAGQGTSKTLATLNAKVAQLDVEIAQHRLDQAIVRAPFEGSVQRVHVVQGEFVRAGQPLATVVDTRQLNVEVPVDRNSVQVGDQIEIQVERQTITATVQGILPLTPAFEPLRDLFESVATAVAVVDNPGGQFKAGQTVYAPMIPRLPVAEIPNEAIDNSQEGTRQVQVIRDGFVRDVTIDLLGAVGEERTVISGRFNTGDELVVRSSEQLLDGTQVVPRIALEAPAGAGGAATGRTPSGSGPSQTPGAAPGGQRPGGF
jgi:multidrug efflux pump subunit AcrA (membrane-fusion protein)